MEFNNTGAMLDRSDSPSVKRQKKSDGGYNSTSTSAQNTKAYNSDNDSGDDLFANFVPATPSGYQTQPTQILDRPFQLASSPPDTPHHVVQVPASSPFTGRDNQSPRLQPQSLARPVPTPNRLRPVAPSVSMSMAPAGTTYHPPRGIVPKPQTQHITINDEDDGPSFQGGSSDEDGLSNANIKPTAFISRGANSSFGVAVTNNSPNQMNGNSKFMGAIQNAKYNPQLQNRPDRAQPVGGSPMAPGLQEHIRRVRQILPTVPIQTIKNALLSSHGSLDNAIAMLCGGEKKSSPANAQWPAPPISISDDEIESPRPVKIAQPDMKRVTTKPIQSINQKYASTQPLLPKPASQATPPKPKRRLVNGRRNASPATSAAPSPLRAESPAMDSYDSDSGIVSVVEEDPRLEAKVLTHLNKCSLNEFIELTNCPKESAELMINARPFKSLDAARCVEKPKTLKGGKKSTRAPIGDRLVDIAMEMFQGYESIDGLVNECEKIGKPLMEEMSKWGINLFGKEKDGQLDMTSLGEHDSGIGTPSSGSASANGDDDVKVVSRKRSGVQFLKKPEMMAESCELKDYQVVGLNWLALIYRHKLSGILADEMGLGKTCQVIAFLSHLFEEGNPGPHLVVCPGTTLENWMREFQKFSPNLVTYAYHGPIAERPGMAEYVLEHRDSINVVVTTYEMAKSEVDNKFMRRLKPDVCVYDEGHYLKNVKSMRYKALIKIPADFRLLLTGTPLQNNLRELVALLAFMLPSVFKEVEEDLNFIFKAKATTSDANHAALLSQQRIARARSMLTSFVLRRKKEQVMKDLPAKTTRVQYCELSKPQKNIYKKQVKAAKERALRRSAGEKSTKADQNNNPMMQSRKAAIHPQLFRRHFTDEMCGKMTDILRKRIPDIFKPTLKREHLYEELLNYNDYTLHQWCNTYPCISSFDVPELSWMDSGKVKAMLELVNEYKKNGDRCLLFSQFSSVLDILEGVMNSERIAFTRIDGSTPMAERQSLIDIFTEDDSITVFMLTTKAGGTGINLVAANKVIIFDSSFNPQDDLQAENRAHRVGQTRAVEVVQLVTKRTVEEKILRLGQSKLLLDKGVSGDDAKESSALEEAGEREVERMLLEEPDLSSDEEEDPVKVEEKPTPQKMLIKLTIKPKKKAVEEAEENSKRSRGSRKRKSPVVDADFGEDDEILM